MSALSRCGTSLCPRLSVDTLTTSVFPSPGLFMTTSGHPQFILTLSCPDRPGVVYAVSSFLVQHNCTVISSQQFGDQDTGTFFMRVRFWCSDGDDLGALQRGFERMAAPF